MNSSSNDIHAEIFGRILDFLGQHDGTTIPIKTDEESKFFLRLFNPYLKWASGDELIAWYTRIRQIGIEPSGRVVYCHSPIEEIPDAFVDCFGEENICHCDSITDFLIQTGTEALLYSRSNPVFTIK